MKKLLFISILAFNLYSVNFDVSTNCSINSIADLDSINLNSQNLYLFPDEYTNFFFKSRGSNYLKLSDLNNNYLKLSELKEKVEINFNGNSEAKEEFEKEFKKYIKGAENISNILKKEDLEGLYYIMSDEEKKDFLENGYFPYSPLKIDDYIKYYKEFFFPPFDFEIDNNNNKLEEYFLKIKYAIMHYRYKSKNIDYIAYNYFKENNYFPLYIDYSFLKLIFLKEMQKFRNEKIKSNNEISDYLGLKNLFEENN